MQSSSITRSIGPLSLRYAPSKVSPVCALASRSRRSAMGGRETACAIDGQTAHPATNDRNKRRSIAPLDLAKSRSRRSVDLVGRADAVGSPVNETTAASSPLVDGTPAAAIITPQLSHLRRI